MMLSLRTRIFIIISLVVLVILGLSVFFILLGKKKTASTPGTEENTVVAPDTVVLPGGQIVNTNPVAQGLTPQLPTTLEVEQNSVRQLARIFIERYNSYSSASNFENLLEVKDLSTPALWAKISSPLSKPVVPGAFIGVTTLAVNTELADWSAGRAVVNVKTHITEEKNGATASRLSGVAVHLVKSGDAWLVDKFIWEK